MKTRLQAFVLAAAIAATALTGGIAAAGLAHQGSRAAVPVQVRAPAALPQPSWHEQDD
jgi:hypothetical protein